MEIEKFTEKLRFYLKSKNIKQKDLADMVGVSAVTINNLLNGRDKFGARAAAKWSDALGLNPLWLLTQGEKGEMLLETLNEQPVATIATADPNAIYIPIINLDSEGGFKPNGETDVMEYAIGSVPFNRDLARHGDIVVPVHGESMSPRYPAGSLILIRPIEAWREYIELGRSYVLELMDWRRVIKIVRRGSDKLHYLLDSYNVDFESAEIPINFIKRMWLVVASVNREVM